MNSELSDEEIKRHVTMFWMDRFKCELCGMCCTISEPILVTLDDMMRIAKHLKKPVKTIKRKYTKVHPDNPGQYSLKNTKPCNFYDKESKKCKIYSARPSVCRSYPFADTEFAVFGLRSDCPGAKNLTVELKKADDMRKKLMENKEFQEMLKDPEAQRYFKQHLENERIELESKILTP